MSRTIASHLAFSLNRLANHVPRLRDCCTGWRPLFMSEGSSGGQIHSRQVRPKWLPNSGDASSASISFARLSGALSSRNAAACSGVGTRPLRSRYTRRKNSASAATAAAFSWRSASRSPTCSSTAVATTFGSWRLPFGSNGFSSFLSVGAYVGSPATIHALSVALSFAESGGFSLGMSFSAMANHSSLSSGLPVTTAGPALPPLSINGSVRKSNSPF